MRPNIICLFSGSSFIFTSPKPREKCEELQVRLKKLAAAAEKKAYEELVKDITSSKSVEEPFSSYKDQIVFGYMTKYEKKEKAMIGGRRVRGQSSRGSRGGRGSRGRRITFSSQSGLHVVLIMFTGYLVGYAALKALFGHSPAMGAAGGILGLVVGMLVETLLFIIRTTSQDRPPSYFTSRIKKDQ